MTATTTPYNSAYKGTTPFSNTAEQFALAANVALTYTVPGDGNNKYRIKFSWLYNSAVWVGYNVSATSPSAGTIASSPNVELRPDEKYVIGGDVLSFISNSLVTDAGFYLLAIPN